MESGPKDTAWPRGALGDCPVRGHATPPVLVVGCSNQLPDELRAYHLIGAADDGSALLSLHDGVNYTGTMTELSPYGPMLTRMVGAVLDGLPPVLRDSARAALLDRWNRAWAVSRLREACAACDLACHGAGPGSPIHS